MKIDRAFVAVAVDLSRLPDDLIADNSIPDIINVGREVDLLETIHGKQKEILLYLWNLYVFRLLD
jgi:hypothetical protein